MLLLLLPKPGNCRHAPLHLLVSHQKPTSCPQMSMETSSRTSHTPWQISKSANVQTSYVLLVNNLLSVSLKSSLGYLQCQRKHIFLHMKETTHASKLYRQNPEKNEKRCIKSCSRKQKEGSKPLLQFKGCG